MRRRRPLWQDAIKTGLIGGTIAVLLSLIGMVEAFSQRDIVHHVISMGHGLLLLVALFAGYLAAKRGGSGGNPRALVNSLTAGLLVGGILSVLVVLGRTVNLRTVLINASPALWNLLTFGGGVGKGSLLLLTAGALSGLFAGLLTVVPDRWRRGLSASLGSVLTAGVLQDILRPTLAAWPPMAACSEWLFTANGLSRPGAIALALIILLLIVFWSYRGQAIRENFKRFPDRTQRGLRFVGLFLLLALLLALPHLLGLFLSEVLTIVGLYVLLGLGLNIVVGYAGLLDLGYVAFFAIGAYTVAVLTSPELGFFQLSFWAALPFAIALGILSGILLGIPVLKMRGDYLAIATLGFGEIIRILVLSDFLRPWLGGAQGIGKIPKASIGGLELGTPQRLYYLILAGCLLAIFISLRLKNSKLGRAWMAMREDEDVAQAMGINLVATKLLAFATGAGFSALSGAIFASKLSSVYPHSFNVMISINIICLIIVGGMGSIPGVMVGSAVLVGLPELLREFAEYRLFVYGAVLVAMMILRPEGLWPASVIRREVRQEESVREDGKQALEPSESTR